jgi:hypothetical protein
MAWTEMGMDNLPAVSCFIFCNPECYTKASSAVTPIKWAISYESKMSCKRIIQMPLLPYFLHNTPPEYATHLILRNNNIKKSLYIYWSI